MIKKVEDIHAEDGIKLRTRMWLPEKPLAALQCLHGIMEHSERYGDFAEWMAERGVAVVIHDHRGHGYSSPVYGDTGYFAKKDGWKKALMDVEKIREHLKSYLPDIPHVLLGHSMGSLLARNYFKDTGNNLDGLILSGTMLPPAVMIKLGLASARLSILLRGWRQRSRLLAYITYGQFSGHFKPKRTKFDWLSKRTGVVDKYIKDPLCGQRPTNSLYRDILSSFSEISDPGQLKGIKKDIPILLFSGNEDPIGDFGKGPVKVAGFYRKNGFRNVELILYEKGRHEMLNDREQESVYKDILDWINKNVIKD